MSHVGAWLESGGCFGAHAITQMTLRFPVLFDSLRLLQYPLHQRFMRGIQILAHEAGQESVTAHVAVFADVQARRRKVEAQLSGFRKLAWH